MRLGDPAQLTAQGVCAVRLASLGAPSGRCVTQASHGPHPGAQKGARGPALPRHVLWHPSKPPASFPPHGTSNGRGGLRAQPRAPSVCITAAESFTWHSQSHRTGLRDTGGHGCPVSAACCGRGRTLPTASAPTACSAARAGPTVRLETPGPGVSAPAALLRDTHRRLCWQRRANSCHPTKTLDLSGTCAQAQV